MRYIVSIFIAFIMFNLLWVAVVYIQIGKPTQMSKWSFEAYNLKEKYSFGIKNRKIIIVSGSNSLFGIDSKMLEAEWKIPVVNNAVNAGLGMPYILYQSKKILKENDIAILPLEYSFYTMTDEPSTQYVDYILSRDIIYFNSLSIHKKLKIIFFVSIKRLLYGLKSYIRPLKKTTGLYGIQNINTNGDQVNIDFKSMNKKDFENLDEIKADEIKSTQLSIEFKESLNTYISWAKQKNITLIFMPPNHMYFKEYDSSEYKLFLENIKKYYNDMNLSYVGNPKSYMYSKYFYYNTSYHLNNLGVTKRTKQLIIDVNKNAF